MPVLHFLEPRRFPRCALFGLGHHALHVQPASFDSLQALTRRRRCVRERRGAPVDSAARRFAARAAKEAEDITDMDSDAEVSYRMGDKVEARYRGKARYYPGKISRARAAEGARPPSSRGAPTRRTARTRATRPRTRCTSAPSVATTSMR